MIVMAVGKTGDGGRRYMYVKVHNAVASVCVSA